MRRAQHKYWRELWRATHNVNAAAATAGVHRSFAYKILVKLGIKAAKKPTGNAEYQSLGR